MLSTQKETDEQLANQDSDSDSWRLFHNYYSQT